MDIVRKLNCKFEYAPLAQSLMHKLLPSLDCDTFLKSCNKDEKNQIDAANLFETIGLYNLKHYSRMDRQYQNSFFVDYIVSLMTLQEEQKQEEPKEEAVVGKKRRRSSGKEGGPLKKQKKN